MAKGRALVRVGFGDRPSENSFNDEDLLTVDIDSREALSSSLSSCGVDKASLSEMTIVMPSEEVCGRLYDPLALASIVPFLKSDSTLTVSVLASNGRTLPKVVASSFLLAGLRAESETRGGDSTSLTGRKIAKATGKSSSAPLKLTQRNKEEEEKKTDIVQLDGLDDDDDLIDEDTLLLEEQKEDGFLSPPPSLAVARASKNSDDCGGRKACDNCTCGRAEQEAAAASGTSAPAPKQAPKSACGNCALGDAFRCAGCPYLGKPAFKPGEEHLVLDLTDDL